MPTSFLSLPSELRNKIYALCLSCERPLIPWNDYNQPDGLALGLLRTNKAIQVEANSIFYASNLFDLSESHPYYVTAFFETIGSRNADRIRHIRLYLPRIEDLDSGHFVLERNDMAIVELVQEYCTNLITLTAYRDIEDDMELILDEVDNQELITEALQQLDAHFRAIPSLQEIILEVHEDGPSSDIRREVESLGWEINVIGFGGTDLLFSDSDSSWDWDEEDDYDDDGYEHDED
ncbi:hypothetical protein PVAG01_10809 [Phlyctema vagabunda]|uniref:F-box domain-containing protein n=1 Tax=Phlyctema vagabunda TaxID=108571 RepID=A0ABR4P3B4_9HELO